MASRRFLVLIAIVTTATSFFLLGFFHARAGDAADRAAYDAKLDAIRAEVKSQLGTTRRGDAIPAGTSGGETWDASRAPVSPVICIFTSCPGGKEMLISCRRLQQQKLFPSR